jgi:sterol desaturase/sphingolipid hydroxylase (fatty acid hydroxylase superfamily)
MELYGKILLVAMPIFLALVLLEKAWGWYTGRDRIRTMDMLSSLSSGVTNVVKDVMGLSITIISYTWMVNHLAIWHVESTLLTIAITFLVLDFQGYWVHRWRHEINLFWNEHVIHHSSEDYNLACALRQSIASFVNIFTFFLLPAALLGVPANVIAIVAPIHLFAQFWYHTEFIGKMGILESIIVTPSHHRVHHAINPEYMDRNYSQIFIFWDKLFGTFQEELPDVKPVYGISRPARTWNPIKINFQHLWLLMKDAWHTHSLRDKFRIWFMPTGWRPEDVKMRFPVAKIEDVYHFEKYQPQASAALKTWTWVQFTWTILMVLYFFGNLGRIGSPGVFYYGVFIFLTIYSFTELMDRNPYALGWEIVKNITGFGLIWYVGDWFGSDTFIPGIQYGIEAYFIISSCVTAWLVLGEINRDQGDPRMKSYLAG